MTNQYQTQFDINLSDMDLIESALRDQANKLGQTMIADRLAEHTTESSNEDQHKSKMTAIQLLLGKLHNQKIWYAPENYSLSN